MGKGLVWLLCAALLCFNTATAQVMTVTMHCQLQVPSAVHGTAIWYQMGYPFNLTANSLGLIPGSTLYQLSEQAFGLWQQGLDEATVTQQVNQRCTRFSLAELEQEYTFFEEGGNTPYHLTVCADTTTMIVQSFDNLDGQPFTLSNLKNAISGEEQKPAIERMIVQAFNFKQQGQLNTAVLEQTFANCQQQPLEYKEQLAAELYTE